MKKINITAFQLKILGSILMVFDHVAQFFQTVPIWFHWLGRPVFPIFLFLTVEGFTHTRNKLKYMFRLLVGFWFMGIMTTLMMRYFPMDDVVLMNNVFSTLFLGVFYMYCIELFISSIHSKKIIKSLIVIPMMIFPIKYFDLTFAILDKTDNLTLFQLMFRGFPSVTTAEGGFLMVVLAVVLYVFKFNKHAQMLSIITVSLLTVYGNNGNLLTENYQWMMVFSIIPILLYNGKKGKGYKHFFYIFYPAHIYGLYLLSYFLKNK